MSFIRPEARAALWRWREALVGASGFAFGLWWFFSGGSLTRWVGVAVALASLALLMAGVQRGRFRVRAGGLGVVRADEGQVAYFGPLTGGVVALSEMSQLRYDATGRPEHWVLAQPGQPDLFIPVNAEGADALFDIFVRLPGLKTERLLSVMRKTAQTQTVLWQRDRGAALPGQTNP
ncbi:MAG: hypothetical protein AAF280_00210 [Pseudomonadota bacterium]